MNLSDLHALPQFSYVAGDVIIHELHPMQGVFFLESGEVEVLKNGVQIADIYETGAVFGEMSWLLHKPPTATVRAISACTMRHVAHPESFFREFPDSALHVAEILARRLDSLNGYLMEIKRQFDDRADHLGIIDEVLDSLIHKHPRKIPRRSTGD